MRENALMLSTRCQGFFSSSSYRRHWMKQVSKTLTCQLISYPVKWLFSTLVFLCFVWENTLPLLCPYEKGHMSSWQGGVGLPRPAYFPCTPLNTSHTLKNTFLNLSQEISKAHLLKPYIIYCKHFHYLLYVNTFNVCCKHFHSLL